MNKDLQQIEEKIDTLTEVVGFIKDRMATKDELKDGLAGLKAELKVDINRLETKVDNFMDSETDKRKQLEVRVSKVEAKVSAK